MKRLDKKVAVVYGDGATGRAIASAFAKEGAKVFLTGRNVDKLTKIAEAITAEGGAVKTAVLDVLDEAAVEEHMESILAIAGRLDISYNAIGIPQTGVQGSLLTEISLENFSKPLGIYPQAHFITARAAAKRMITQGNGVILMHTPNASTISEPFIGGMPSAWAAVEALNRSLSVELAPHGIRSVCLQTTAIPETPLIDEVFEIHGKAHGVSFDDFTKVMEGNTQRKKLTTLKELTTAAVFAASDEGSGLTGTRFNITAGMII